MPIVARGDFYGVGMTMPDTITLYQIPIEDEADDLLSIAERDGASIGNFQQEVIRGQQIVSRVDMIRKVIRDTIWHEVAHHFGYDEFQVRDREAKRDRGPGQG